MNTIPTILLIIGSIGLFARFIYLIIATDERKHTLYFCLGCAVSLTLIIISVICNCVAPSMEASRIVESHQPSSSLQSTYNNAHTLYTQMQSKVDRGGAKSERQAELAKEFEGIAVSDTGKGISRTSKDVKLSDSLPTIRTYFYLKAQNDNNGIKIDALCLGDQNAERVLKAEISRLKQMLTGWEKTEPCSKQCS